MVRRMADEVKPRAVSGEIMTDAAPAAHARAARPDDVIDADYISLPGRSALSAPKPRDSSPRIGPAETPAGRMDMLRQSETKIPPGPGRGGPLFWTIGVGLVAAAFWISGGHALLHDVPFAGRQVSRSALSIYGITSRIDASGAQSVLLVDGEAVNDGEATEHLPPLEIAVIGNDGLTTRYRLGTSGRPLSSGETFAFSSRLDAPKNGVKTVSVRFAQ
jgi:hypothetical protein